MKISKDKRKNELLSSFEILSENFSENSSKIATLIGTMFNIDVAVAVEMWEHLLHKYPEILRVRDTYNGGGVIFSNNVYDLTNEIIGECRFKIEIVANAILTNPFIKMSLFEISGCIHYHTINIIKWTIENNRLREANELLEMIDRNPNRGTSLFTVLDGAIPYEIKNEDAFDLLKSWVDRLKSSQEKANLNVSLIKAIENGDNT